MQTIYKLLSEDVTQLMLGSDNCIIPCIEVKGSCQFIRFLKSHLNETAGTPTIITQAGCCTEVRVYKLATFRLVTDESITAGYTAKLL